MIELDKIAHEIAADINGFDWNEVDMGDMLGDEEFYPEEEEQSARDESGSEEEEGEITNEHNFNEVVMEILPATHIVVTKAYLEMLRNDLKTLRRLEKAAFGGKQYNGTNLGESFCAPAMVQNSSLSFYSFEQIIPLVISSGNL